MRSTIKRFCNTVVTVLVVIILIYLSFFTSIPNKTGNLIKEKIEKKKYTYEEYTDDFKINKLGIKMNNYYYNLLNDSEKKIYSSIANGIKNFQDEFVIRDYVVENKDDFANDVNNAIEAFINDHPEVFYLKAQYSSYVIPSFEGNYGYVKVNYTEDSKENIISKIEEMDSKINMYTADLDGKSEYEKELIIHDRLSYDVTYSKSNEIAREYHTAEGALLEGVGVCDSFTKALQLLYNRVGIDSIIVLGQLDNSPHAWNLVKIDDEWYHVDLTSSHSIYDETGIVTHAYFNLNTQSMKKICSIEDEKNLPVANSDKYNYYNYNDLILPLNANVSTKMSSIVKESKDEKCIEFYLEGNVGERISTVLTALKKIDSSFIKDSKMYYYNIQNAIIIPKN